MKEEMKMHFSSRSHSGKGIAGFVLAIFCAVILLLLCILSAMAGGNAGSYIGAIGMLVFFADIASFVLSMKGVKEKDVYTTLPMVGMIVSGIILVVLFCLYIIGIA